ncbi:LamG domain-containing protein [Chloroflexota bacterium]
MSRDAYGHLCTVTGALWRPYGRYFDGADDGINCGNSPALGFGTGDFTLEVWVYCNGYVNNGSTHNGIVVRGTLTAGNTGMYGIYLLNTNKPKFSIDTDVNSAMATVHDISGGWHHLIGLRNGSAIALYVDTVQDGMGTNSGSTDSSLDLVLGRDTGVYRYFDGTIGEVRISNRALNPQEIQRNYLSTKWRYR